MKKEWFKNLIQKLIMISNSIENYFTSGSFGIKFYPFLMHPCVRKSCSILIFIVAIISSFTGLYYLLAEHITILFSARSFTAYFHHSTLELQLPVGSVIDGKVSELSPLHYVISFAFSMQAVVFFFLYAIGITHIALNRLRVIGLIFALLFAIGCSFIAGTQGGKYTEYGFYNLGAGISFIIGNLTLIIAGADISHPSISFFKKYSLSAGVIGIACLLFTMCVSTVFNPLIERVGIYTIMIWEILAGFAIIKRLRKH